MRRQKKFIECLYDLADRCKKEFIKSINIDISKINDIVKKLVSNTGAHTISVANMEMYLRIQICLLLVGTQ